MKGKQCKLVMDFIENIVVVDIIIEGKKPTNEVNEELLWYDFYYVFIHVSLNGAALLPKFKDSEVVHVRQVIGRLVAWPKDLVFFEDEKVNTTTNCFMLKLSIIY